MIGITSNCVHGEGCVGTVVGSVNGRGFCAEHTPPERPATAVVDQQSNGDAKVTEPATQLRYCSKCFWAAQASAADPEPCCPTHGGWTRGALLSELEAVRLELEQQRGRADDNWALVLAKNTDLTTERARAEGAVGLAESRKLAFEECARLLASRQGELAAANARAARLEEELAKWRAIGGPERAKLVASLSAAPQVSTEQCGHWGEMTIDRATGEETCSDCEGDQVAGHLSQVSTEQVKEKCDSCQGPLPEPTQVYSLARANAAGKRFCRKGCARDWQDANPTPIQTSPIPQVAQAVGKLAANGWPRSLCDWCEGDGQSCQYCDAQPKPPEPLTAEALQAKLIAALRATAPNANLITPEAMLGEVADRLEGK